MEVTGSSPVMPIRENKNEWGKVIVMSVCTMQTIRFANCEDSQRNLITCGLTKAGK